MAHMPWIFRRGRSCLDCQRPSSPTGWSRLQARLMPKDALLKRPATFHCRSWCEGHRFCTLVQLPQLMDPIFSPDNAGFWTSSSSSGGLSNEWLRVRVK
ncbi:unnamed protein product [Durusdinium trenchii]|uniref:Uncharacterized protein n=1 Tax=Durusdinium trenchii TaxID=1381693 RepID=A0ABP0HPA0_9DINO